MAYNKIEVFGSCDINYIWSKDKILSDDDINTLSEQAINSPQWDLNTVILPIFNNSTNATSIDNDNIVSYRIQRRNLKENVLRTVANVEKTDSKIIDFNVPDDETYKYYITPVVEGDGVQSFINTVETSEITPNWCSWSVIGLKDIDEGVYEADCDNIWVFHLNLEPGDYTPVFSKTYTEGMGRFPKGFSGSTNYMKGKLSCYIGDINKVSEYINDDASRVEKWTEFCNNGELKLIRDTKGNAYLADIENTSLQISDYINAKPTKLTFDFIQLGEAKEACVFKVVS